MKLRSKGICILAGAGPGDIGLVTLRTKEAVEQAEVIVYDYLCITPRFLNRRRRKQELSLTLIGPPDRRAEAFFGAHTIIDLVNDGPVTTAVRDSFLRVPSNVDARKQRCAILDVFALRGRAIPDARERLLTAFPFPPVP
jgi:hypothetical protein